ncbi:DUF4344 domain-containing metallopeptidase [Photobacterium kishitanii]|uniref:DUF4344 domain-containing metallopeptidase n=1 Tax=Photobacterium kishitanii TaxID=318456 RepID=UPI0004353AE6|nr:DUF4344 domain-containing metallopeptidase [Photobacterium kishitanii]CEO40721.1 conserved hypothetical protein [Photobacterium kishitanii]
MNRHDLTFNQPAHTKPSRLSPLIKLLCGFLYLTMCYLSYAGTEHPTGGQYGLALDPVATVNFVFIPPVNLQQQQAKDIVQHSSILTTIKQLSQTRYIFAPSLEIIFGSVKGPDYNSTQQQIQIPYHYITQLLQHLRDTGIYPTQQQRYQATADALLVTLLHQIGHAFILDRAIPVLGNSESTVDNFVTILLLNDVDRGDEIAINSGRFFSIRELQNSTLSTNHFIQQHSLTPQRYQHILCLVYGSNPNRYQRLFDSFPLAQRQQQQRQCQTIFSTTHKGWLYYLDN